MTGESLASLLRLIAHFADLALPAKTTTHHGVHRTDTLFYAWRGILAERDAAAAAPRSNVPTPAAASPVFVPVHVRADGPAEANPPEVGCLEILLSGQRVLRIRPGFDAATLQRLLAVLEPPAC